MTAAGLYGAMASSAQTAQGIRPILIWRRNMENRCPCSQPAPGPVTLPDEPVPDDGGAPIFDQPAPAVDPYLFLAPALVGALVLGLGLGYGRKLFDKINPRVK